MDILEATCNEDGTAALLLPCCAQGRAEISAAEAGDAWMREHYCDSCGTDWHLAAISNDVLTIIASTYRNRPGKIIILATRELY